MVSQHMQHGILRRVGEDHAPREPCVLTPPQRISPGVQHRRVVRVEGERLHDRAQVDHPPGLCAVECDVGSCHVTVFGHYPRVVRTYRGIDHRPAAARTQNPPLVLPQRRPRHARRLPADCVLSISHVASLRRRYCIAPRRRAANQDDQQWNQEE